MKSFLVLLLLCLSGTFSAFAEQGDDFIVIEPQPIESDEDVVEPPIIIVDEEDELTVTTLFSCDEDGFKVTLLSNMIIEIVEGTNEPIIYGVAAAPMYLSESKIAVDSGERVATGPIQLYLGMSREGDKMLQMTYFEGTTESEASLLLAYDGQVGSIGNCTSAN